MRTAEAEAVLSTFAVPRPGVVSELGVRGDAAYLKLTSEADPAEYAVVWTPGDRWFSLDVTGGFSFDHYEEDTPDADVVDWNARLVEAAVAYLDGRSRISSSPILRVPVVHIDTGEEQLDLTLSSLAALKRALRITRRPARGPSSD